LAKRLHTDREYKTAEISLRCADAACSLIKEHGIGRQTDPPDMLRAKFESAKQMATAAATAFGPTATPTSNSSSYNTNNSNTR